ncbi:2,4-dihydroxyhept-2-ene-1,7-dioic acid aldolase-like protein [Aaosphaeria arxii CBS 175.79]|uniref:2,4-dihydroxyhept-2-ene-1,7-dioic acid aldolase-like protein n=1 Tax=Aaosphaeria arxii CBS 175.79 TaxID=1450172 RepID=A0A6A5Y3L0_9PLEO|nr:2,4-dihydroxyhept-2-ene-1,7-dioic acid aldolase-like protein [Aaosphaeria arxii CBS 175.79]KAF2019846.1 2,4-dihydroxyhept-2-ene-1,7-dioic acid aldolase-like protein [Aaosphaeria arxii CBS 175.79]
MPSQTLTPTPPSIAPNNLLKNASNDRICTAFGIKITPDTSIVHIAKSAGYDSLFIDIEHTSLTIKDANQLCIAANSAGITPFVRVPHQCGDGFIQRVLDLGAMGVIIPHIHGVEDAKRAIRISKYAPLGKRSISAGFPQFEFAPLPVDTITTEMNAIGSTVFIMVETADALETVDDIAALPGCDVLLVGSNDLASEIGTLGDWDAPAFLDALEKVGNAAKKHGKLMGIAGLYHRPDILERVINEFGAKWIVGAQDVGLLLQGGKSNSALLRSLEKTSSKNGTS